MVQRNRSGLQKGSQRTSPHSLHLWFLVFSRRKKIGSAREVEETVPGTFAGIVTSIRDLKKLYRAYEKGDHTAYADLLHNGLVTVGTEKSPFPAAPPDSGGP